MNLAEYIWVGNVWIWEGLEDFFTVHLWSFLKTEKELVTSIGTVITVLTALVGTIIGLFNLWSLKKNSIAQTRPYVQASLAVGVQHHGSIDVIIENRGNSTAHNIQFSIDKDQDQHEAGDYITPLYHNKVFKKKYSLAPGARFRWMWAAADTNTSETTQKIFDQNKELVKALKSGETDRSGFIDAVNLQISYESAPGVFRKIQKYTEIYPLDAISFMELAPLPFKGTTKTSTSQSTEDSLANINEALRTLNIHTGMKNY